MAIGSRRIAPDLRERVDEASELVDPYARRDALRLLIPEVRAALAAKAAKAILPTGIEDRDWSVDRGGPG